jgi:hypothetical protein
MGYISKVVSCKTILAAIERTFKPGDSSWMREAIEDIGWAIQGIGYHVGFENKQTLPPYLTVRNNRVKIPCDVERIIHIEQLLPNSTLFNVLNPDGTTPFPQPGETTCNTTYKGVRMRLGTDTSGYGLSQDNPRTTGIKPDCAYYSINGEYINTEFEQGLIKLHYVGFILDKNQLPMIVDDFDYKTAIQWYIVQNMILKGFKHPDVSFKEAYQLWERYRDKAENSVKGISLDAAERFRAGWNRVSNNEAYGRNFYIGLEQPEFVING